MHANTRNVLFWFAAPGFVSCRSVDLALRSLSLIAQTCSDEGCRGKYAAETVHIAEVRHALSIHTHVHLQA